MTKDNDEPRRYCGLCRFHYRGSKRPSFGGDGGHPNGSCTNPESPRHKVVTGWFGSCDHWEAPPPPQQAQVAMLPNVPY